MSDTAPVERNRSEQSRLYGASLGEVFGRIQARLGLTQARLAQVLGLSAPMLSQLMSAQRVKIGNPAVVARVSMLSNLADQVERGEVAADALDSQLDDVARASGVITRTTEQSVRAGAGDGARAVRDLLRAQVPPAELAAAVRALRDGHPAVAAFLQRYGGADEGDSAVAPSALRQH